MQQISLVAGAGGFIGGHLVQQLMADGHRVRAVDRKPLDQWYQLFPGAENLSADLSLRPACQKAVSGVTTVFNLAADMGGMGYIESNKAACMLNVLINTHLLMAAQEAAVARFFFASSACVYAADKQLTAAIPPLKEADSYPAMPEDGYGWEKLFGERMCRHFREDFGLQTRMARYHNVYGPHETYFGGREKAPAAICRKVAQAVLSGSNEIEIWGDGEQTRSFTYIDDCIKGSLLVTAGAYAEPVNVGSSEMVTINQLVSHVEKIAGVRMLRRYDLDAPCGVRGRNSDNTLIQSLYDWQPSTPLIRGLEVLYRWVFDQLKRGS
ncbi:MAG: NAD-dependent epimerase/dehydratase family protein [Opitutae bacterium]|nr:NAD-dependent epimerase/dehydratase family protein [Opitutae bacterium]